MISAIIYGRNDSYSYALDHRTALGLNQLARQLQQGRDEIIFVDYNTDDDLPTYPEAIADTLTPEARALIRVIRVRPEVHLAAEGEGPPVREAFCRNVALRRISEASEWIYSTNPDCLLLSETDETLSNLVEWFPDGYFGLPRFELPRVIWQSLPRTDPEEAHRLVSLYARSFALDAAVSHYMPEIGFDGPGDFQLAKTKDVMQLCGFDESMTLGWHVDSNLNARLAKKYTKLSNFNAVCEGGPLKLYHTEHTRRISPKHHSVRSIDSFETYVENVEHSIPPAQADNWGAAGEQFEEFALSDPPVNQTVHALCHIAQENAVDPVSFVYGPETYDNLPSPPDVHVGAFLIDHFATLRPGAAIGWLSERPERAEWLRELIGHAGLKLSVLDLARSGSAQAIIEKADVICLEAPLAEGARAGQSAQGQNMPGGATKQALAQIICAEHDRYARGEKPRRIIGLNIPHSQYETPYLTFVSSALTPVVSRLRFGEVFPSEGDTIDLTPEFQTGPAGRFDGPVIVNRPNNDGYAALLCRAILPGKWRIDFEVQAGMSIHNSFAVDVALDVKPVNHVRIRPVLPGLKRGSITFESGLDGMFGRMFECRLWSYARSPIALKKVVLTRIE